jgi:Methyltransferase FkbM domain
VTPKRTISEKFYVAKKLFLRGGKPWERMRQFWRYQNEVKMGARAGNFAIRQDIVCAAEDNAKIPRVERAGQVVDGALIMHNGLRVLPDSYIGAQMTDLLRVNKGVHEPQEEFAFAEVLSRLQERRRAAYTMLELGAYWAFYSLWFQTTLPGARCYCVEPDAEFLESGKRNFRFNGLEADFTQAFVGAKATDEIIPTISVDSLARDKKIEHIDILHSDIQGFELEMLTGAQESFSRGLVDYVFISTHGHLLHYQCLDALGRAGFRVLADADMMETVSADGVIVAARIGLDRLELEPISITPRNYQK